MKRNCTLEEISDGKLYTSEDLVQVSCNGCKGEASCCHGMGKSIILDPQDMNRLTNHLNTTFEGLLSDKIELGVVDGIILPNLKMSGQFESCSFLNEQGRCSIHECRPGICRIFPLGRYYENHGFHYFLQKDECRNPSKTMVKLNKWVDTPELAQNEQFVTTWHYFLNEVEDIIKNTTDDKLIKNINMYLLNSFYIKKYDSERDFYQEFQERLQAAKEILNLPVQ